jgi:type I restriction enzyme, S subunit
MIGEHVEILSGYAFNSKEFNTNEEGIPLVRIRDVGKIRSKTYYTGKYSNKYILENGDFLIGMDGDFRLAIWNGGKALLNQRVCKITPNESVFNSGYMYYMLPKELKRIEDTTSFATVKHLSVKKIKDIKIPLPPLDQQKKIAAILDAADAYRQKTKALIEKYDELTQSLFLDMFGDPVTNPKGWGKVKLGKISHMKAGKFVKASDIKSEKNSKLYSCYGGNGLRGYVESFTHEGEFLLIGRQGALCGNVKRVNGEFHATEHAIVCSPTMKYESLWLYHMLVMINLNKYATGAAQPGLNVGTLVDLEVMFASYNLQNQFAERVQAIEEQKAQAQSSLAQAEDLFNSLLQRAFKGELTN